MPKMSRMVSLGGFVLDGGRSQQPGNKKKILCKISLEIDCSEVGTTQLMAMVT